MNNLKKARNNLLIGILGEIVVIILGIIVPRLTLTSYGSEVNGLVNSVTQIYSYFVLLEAGAGSVARHALYKNISVNNIDGTNAVLSAVNKYYHRTGVLYIVGMALFSVIYPLVVKTDIPTFTVVCVIIFNGLGHVISYFFHSKYFLLLSVEGKLYIRKSLDIFTNIFKNVAKIILMALGMDVIFVQMIATAVSLIQMVFLTIYIKKKYKWIDLSVEPDKSALSQRGSATIHQASILVFNSTDMIILTLFCGLSTVSVYSMYAMLFGMISSIISITVQSFEFMLGQTYFSDREKFVKLYNAYELVYLTLTFALFSVANFFIIPFLRLYTAGVNDISYIDEYLPLLFVLVNVMTHGRETPAMMIRVAGHFKNTLLHAVIEALINLTVSLIAVNFLGIYGVLIGTVAALLFRANAYIIYAGKHVLNIKPWVTYKRWGINFALLIICYFVGKLFNFPLDSYKNIILCCIPYTIATLVIFFSVAALSEPKNMKNIFGYVKNKLKNLRKRKSSDAK